MNEINDAMLNRELIDFLEKSPDSFHAVLSIEVMLEKAGFSRLSEAEAWELREGGGYYVCRNDSSIIAFRLNRKDYTGYMIAAAHTDSPAFKIKDTPEMQVNGYVRLNVEGYGGMLMAPWLDRPLSVSGRLAVREADGVRTVPVKVDEDLLLIPNLAIHMNRDANAGMKYSVQTDMLPLYGDEQDAGSFMKHVAGAAGVREEDILAHDLNLYVRERGRLWGARQQYLCAPRLDDLQCAFAVVKGLAAAGPESPETAGRIPESPETAIQAGPSCPPACVSVAAVFDNEEVGSVTKQGADSSFLSDVLRRIALCCGKTEEAYMQALAGSFMVSADNAHALHPNHPEKADPVNRPKMNAGIVIKYSANQKYTTDAVSAAVFKKICEAAGVPVQVFTNHSDQRGGSTLGNISNSHISIDTVDIGLPQLAMHSPFETAGAADTAYLVKAMETFFSHSLQREEGGKIRLLS